MKEILWHQQHAGVYHADYTDLIRSMPDLLPIFGDFPENPHHFTWDVKVHMLMPNQFPGIPNWHFDHVPRVNGVQDFTKTTPENPIYMWLSGEPFTEFKDGRIVKACDWVKFTQEDEHRVTMSFKFCWRGFIRGTHRNILNVGENYLRRHSQVYLDSKNFKW